MEAAESPSVRMRVHSLDFAVPAHRASSNFTMPRTDARFLPSVFLASFMRRAARMCWASSSRPIFTRDSTNLSVILGLDPNLVTGVVKHSFVCVSKLGLTITERINHVSESLRSGGVTSTFFFLASSQNSLRTCVATWSTCFPPRRVRIPFTNERWRSSGGSSL